MSEKIVKELRHIGALNTNSNRVQQDSTGARSLINCGDLDGDGHVMLLPGTAKILASPMLADYATGTVTVTLDSKTVTGSGTTFLTNAYRGDLFKGPDGLYYEVADVKSGTVLTLTTAYSSATAAGASYLIRHKVWMLAPFKSQSAGITATSDIVLNEMVGCGPNLYTSISLTAATVNTTIAPSVRPAAWCTYNNDFFFRTGHTALRRWDAINAADTTVASMTKTDGSAGVDPPDRAWICMVHNDKLFTGGYAGQQYYTGTSTGMSETVLTNSGTSFTTTATGMIGWKLRPDGSVVPEQWFVITANTGTAATCTGSLLITNGGGTVGDTYYIHRFYPKTVWYSNEAEPADTPTANFLNFNSADGDMIQQLLSHNNNLLVICSGQLWIVRGYGPDTPWEKRMVSKTGGTLSPMSVVATAYDALWWGEEGIVRSASGTGVPEVIDTAVREITIDAVNKAMIHNVVGCSHKGWIYWSYPSGTSNINNKTIVYNPSNGRWALYNFGMYAPMSVLGTDGVTSLKFWEPTTGCLCKVDETIYTHLGAGAEFTHTTAFVAASNPTELAQWLFARAVIVAGQTFTATVSVAYDYGDTYTSVGALVPIDGDVSGRTSVNATDRIYICRFPASVRGASISLRITGSTSAALKILQLSVIADPVEYGTYK